MNLDLDIKNELNLLENKRNNYELINLNSTIDNLRLNIKDNTIINDDQKNDLISQLESIENSMEDTFDIDDLFNINSLIDFQDPKC